MISHADQKYCQLQLQFLIFLISILWLHDQSVGRCIGSETSFHTALKLFTYQIIKQEKEEIRAIHKGHHRQIGSRTSTKFDAGAQYHASAS